MTEPEIFSEALLRTNNAERAAYLEQACGADGTLRRRIEHLLALHECGHALFDRRPAELLEALSEKQVRSEADSIETSTKQLRAFLEPATRPDSLGRLGHYEVLEVLGQGGFGIVVKAFDDTLHRIVAIKVLAPHLAVTSAPRKRFLREARAAAQIRHEHVVQIYAVEEEPLPYQVMEFIEGQTLQQKLDATGPLEATEVVRLGQQIALGLAAAHEKGLIHRDVKPANILLEAGIEVRVKLTDFGLARTSDDASMTQSGVVAGTPMYMAPEQANGAPLDPRADLFSLGSVLYSMTAGRPPFRAPNSLAVLKRVTQDRPRPIREVIADVPEGLCAVISRLHAKNPADRFGSARETAEAISLCLTNPIRRRARGARLIQAASAAAILLVLAGGTWIASGLFGRGNPDAHSGEVASKDNPVVDRSEPKEPIPALPPSDSWTKGVALMDADDQVSAVVAKLKKLNPDFDDKSVLHTTENNVVVAFKVNNCDNLNDLSPLRAFPALTDLRLTGRGAADISPLRGMKLVIFETNGCPIKDLSPLAGMPLKTLNLWLFATDDLSPLRGMKLVAANLGGSPVKDISVLKGMPIEALCLNHSQIDDLSPLEGMPLRVLECENTRVTSIVPLLKSQLETLWLGGSPVADYTPLQKLPVKNVSLNYQPESHAQLLRSIPTLQTVNKKPVAEVLDNDGK
jgi:serine/threonine protein kinase